MEFRLTSLQEKVLRLCSQQEIDVDMLLNEIKDSVTLINYNEVNDLFNEGLLESVNGMFVGNQIYPKDENYLTKKYGGDIDIVIILHFLTRMGGTQFFRASTKAKSSLISHDEKMEQTNREIRAEIRDEERLENEKETYKLTKRSVLQTSLNITLTVIGLLLGYYEVINLSVIIFVILILNIIILLSLYIKRDSR
ncbi:MAG: hypothetical protein Q7I99_04245 [Acholeplasmataceae bacterium]|nr:hypothetical protein [Acholeplasmataceae bacterium]